MIEEEPFCNFEHPGLNRLVAKKDPPARVAGEGYFSEEAFTVAALLISDPKFAQY